MKAGDILLVADGKSILARGITAFMRRYCKLNNLHYYRLYHHAAIVIEHDGELKVAEAIGRGWVVRPAWQAYTLQEYAKRVDFYRPEKDWTEKELKLIRGLAVNYSLNVTRYDFANFIFQMIMIQTGVWVGKRGEDAEGRLYCSEGVATIINKVRPYMCEEPWRYNPMDLYFEPGLKKI